MKKVAYLATEPFIKEILAADPPKDYGNTLYFSIAPVVSGGDIMNDLVICGDETTIGVGLALKMRDNENLREIVFNAMKVYVSLTKP